MLIRTESKVDRGTLKTGKSLLPLTSQNRHTPYTPKPTYSFLKASHIFLLIYLPSKKLKVLSILKIGENDRRSLRNILLVESVLLNWVPLHEKKCYSLPLQTRQTGFSERINVTVKHKIFLHRNIERKENITCAHFLPKWSFLVN